MRALSSTHDLRTLAMALALAGLGTQACNCGDTLNLVPGQVKGQVCDPDSGIPLAGATVTLTGGTEKTILADGAGNYIFERVLPGSYTLSADSADGAVHREFDVKVKADEATLVDDSACRPPPFPPGTGGLTGQICNRHTGALITDGEVILTLSSGGLMATRTDDTGHFELTAVPIGNHVVQIRGEGFQRAFAVEIKEGENTDLDLADGCDPVTAEEGGIVGSFCDPATKDDLVGAEVTAQLADGTGEVFTDVTDTNGAFEVNGLPPGLYNVHVQAATFGQTFPNVEVVAGGLTPVLDVENCGDRPAVGRVEGQICDRAAGGRFLGNVQLISGVTVVQEVTTSSDGSFAFNQVNAGVYDVRAFYPPGDPRGSFERTFSGIVVEAFRTTFIQEFDCPTPEQCTQFENVPQQTSDGRILLVVDRSGSMNQNDLGGQVKWSSMKSALINVTAALTSQVEFGLVLFPLPPTQNGGEFCLEGSEVLQPARNNATQISQQLQAVIPDGGTPTAATLGVAADIVARLSPDGRPIAVVLATDGGPNCNLAFADNNPTCRCTDLPNQGNCASFNCLDDTNAVGAVANIKNAGVNTYVIGVPGVENFKDVLNRMADVGGTALPTSNPNDPRFYEANDQTALQAALEAITQRVLTCRIQSATDLSTVNSVTVSVGGAELPRDTARENGWDILEDNHSIELFGAACDIATASSENVIVQTCDSP
jgi:hypothetical protein